MKNDPSPRLLSKLPFSESGDAIPRQRMCRNGKGTRGMEPTVKEDWLLLKVYLRVISQSRPLFPSKYSRSVLCHAAQGATVRRKATNTTPPSFSILFHLHTYPKFSRHRENIEVKPNKFWCVCCFRNHFRDRLEENCWCVYRLSISGLSEFACSVAAAAFTETRS